MCLCVYVCECVRQCVSVLSVCVRESECVSVSLSECVCV